MEQSSAFFSEYDALAEAVTDGIKTVYTSQDGCTRLSKGTLGGRAVALKSLKEGCIGNPLYEGLLRKEYEIGREFDHPNICRTEDFITLPGLGNCIVMQWIEGETLESLIKKKAAPSPRKVALQLCYALEHIHSHQTVHRDLKPGNIIVTRNGQDVKLIDFGFSDADDLVLFKGAAGTREYAAPELIAGERVDARCDIYSLGKIMQKMKAFRKIASRCAAADRNDRPKDIAQVREAILRKERSARLTASAAVAFAVIAAAAGCILWPDIKAAKERREVRAVFERISEEIREAGFPEAEN